MIGYLIAKSMSVSRVPFIAKVLLSVDGAVALGSTRWLGSSRIHFVARTFLAAGNRVLLRILIPDTGEPVDAAVIIEEAIPAPDRSVTACTAVIQKMQARHSRLLHAYLERAARRSPS